jgi:parvulin-like peptidyl-prolyl isomerase
MKISHQLMVLTLFASPIIAGLHVRAQESQAGNQPSQAHIRSFSAAGPQIQPDAPAITIKGLCDSISAPGASSEDFRQSVSASAPTTRPDCQTVVTSQELERLGQAIGVKPNKLEGLAHQYVDMLKFASKGHELGVEKDPIFQEKAKYTYLQAMAQYAVMAMQRRADDFTDAELEEYYKEHPRRFVYVNLSQLAVPKHKLHVDSSGNPVPQPEETLAVEAAEMKKLADRLRKEAAAGADIDKLEERAYEAGLDESVPATDLGQMYDAMVPPEYARLIFDLEEGQVSQVTEDSNEFLIFKVRKKTILPLAEARHWYGQLNMRDMRKSLASDVRVEYNLPANSPHGVGDESAGVDVH